MRFIEKLSANSSLGLSTKSCECELPLFMALYSHVYGAQLRSSKKKMIIGSLMKQIRRAEVADHSFTEQTFVGFSCDSRRRHMILVVPWRETRR